MTRAQYLPTLLICINIASAGMYAMDGDVRHTFYWISAGILTACVSY